MKVIKSKLVIFLCIPLMFLLVVDSFPLSREFEGVCTQVFDGDTAVIGGKIIRLAHIDAPESSQLSYDGVAIGKQSGAFLADLILGKKVKVQYRQRGHYGRIIGTIYHQGEVNLRLVRSGMALAYAKAETKYKSVEYEARLLRKGIFGTLGFDRPNFYRKKMRKQKQEKREYAIK